MINSKFSRNFNLGKNKINLIVNKCFKGFLSQSPLATFKKLSGMRKFGPSLNNFSSFKYHEKVIDHYEKPRNVGSLDKKDKAVGTGLVGAPACGDVMKLQIKVDDTGKIENAVFKTFGCGSAIASSSYATELIKGKTLEDALKIKNSDIAGYLNLPPVKLHCSMLAEDAIKAAVEDFRTKNKAE